MGDVPQDVIRILGPGEQVQLFIQQKIYHPKINVDSVVLTNQRIILRHPHDLRLKRDFTDFSYTDVANAILDKGLLRSTVKCQLRFGGDPLNLADLPNSDAEKAYGIIRSNISRYQTPFATGTRRWRQSVKCPRRCLQPRWASDARSAARSVFKGRNSAAHAARPSNKSRRLRPS